MDIPWSQKVEDINRLMISMMWSGHSSKLREIVAKRILARYSQNLRNLSDLGRPLYRSKELRRLIKNLTKLIGSEQMVLLPPLWYHLP